MASCNLCHLWGRTTDMYNFGSCSVRANSRDRKLDGGFADSDHKARSLHLYRLNMTLAELQYRSEPEGFGWFQSADDTTHECLYLNAKSTVLHSWCLSWILVFSFWIPLCWFSCSFNSFSIFGLYISARLQIIWRPHLWLVWSLTPMVSFLEFSTSNPVSPLLPPFVSYRASLEC